MLRGAVRDGVPWKLGKAASGPGTGRVAGACWPGELASVATWRPGVLQTCTEPVASHKGGGTKTRKMLPDWLSWKWGLGLLSLCMVVKE